MPVFQRLAPDLLTALQTAFFLFSNQHTHTHTDIIMHWLTPFLQTVQAEGCSCTWCTQVCTHALMDPDMSDAKVRKWRLSPCLLQIRLSSLTLIPLLNIHSICPSLINQGGGRQGAALWNEARSLPVVRRPPWRLLSWFLPFVLKAVLFAIVFLITLCHIVFWFWAQCH